MSRSFSVVLITGAAGWLGGLLAKAIHKDPLTPDVKLILVDIVEPKAPDGSNAVVLKLDLTESVQVNQVFNTKFGIPDTVYCLHGLMSRGSEDNFDLGTKINIDSVRSLLESTRSHSERNNPIKFIFASSLAVYGGPLPDVITPSTLAIPQGSYGFAKLVNELYINEYTRRGFVDGRVLRLPTIVVRPGAPSKAASSFLSGIIREPLQGIEAVCPIGNSFDAPELSLKAWLASPETTIKNLVHAKHIPSDKFLSHTRVVCLPGFTASVREELEALMSVAGSDVLKLVKFEDDPVSREIVSSWPAVFDNAYALSLGFSVDEGGIEPVVKRFQAHLASMQLVIAC
ncbi:NAD(P)-binding protein [Pholiota conissans]|uniref:NAD(P)-binding protein n=1 Tax=Pholiota conissans TaxID=109636 RepID=A0A9P5ZBA4_9AGAR|nr:NAD(P)-binding protein [Pholiota conissans]